MDLEEIRKLPENEGREWVQMLAMPWYRKLPEKIQNMVRHTPPIYLYKIRSTGHFATVKSYEEDKTNPEAEILITVTIEPMFNKEYDYAREIFGVPARELEKLKLLSIARMEKILSEARALPWMRRLMNTRSKADVLRGNNPLTPPPTV